MAEASDHGPGIRQRKVMAMTGAPFGGEAHFGTSEYPGRGAHAAEPPNGTMLSDKERSVGHPVKMGEGYMPASRNPDHGPHGHRKTSFG